MPYLVVNCLLVSGIKFGQHIMALGIFKYLGNIFDVS